MVGLLLLLLGCGDKEPQDTGPQPIPECDAGRVVQARTWTSSELSAESVIPGKDWDLEPNYAGPGLAVLDINQDGWLDVAVANPRSGARLILGGEEGFSLSQTVVIPQALGIAAGDLDGDGVPEVLLGRWDGAYDLLGRWDGSDFVWDRIDHTFDDQSNGYALADIDGDGDLDAYCARHRSVPQVYDVMAGEDDGVRSLIFRNNGGTLELDLDALPEDDATGMAFLGQFVDVDDDGDLDLYQAFDFGPYLGPSRFQLNDGDGNFGGESLPSSSRELFAMGVGVGDVDGNGRPDIYVTNIGSPVLLSNQGGAYVDSTAAAGLYVSEQTGRQTSWGVSLVDLDLDGWPEAVVRYGRLNFWDDVWIETSEGVVLDEESVQPDLLMWNDQGSFQEASGFDDPAVGRGLVVGDWDRDGGPDLMTASWDSPEQISVTSYLGRGGCMEHATLQVPPGTRVRSARGTQWSAPAGSFSSGAQELYLALDAGAEVEVRIPGQVEQTLTLEAGEIRSLW